MNIGIAVEDEVLTSEQVSSALERVLTSSMFVQSRRLSQFLRFVVEHSLQGKGSELKEYTIATQVYCRRSDFDPAQDTIVRSEARRLRKKLREYYENEGRGDPLVIDFHPGSYIPIHRMRTVSLEVVTPPRTASCIVVDPFECDAANALALECAFGIVDEILHRLAKFDGITVICSPALRCSQNDYSTEAGVVNECAGVMIHGTVRASDDLLRVTARATTADRRLLWSHQVDSLVRGSTLIHLQERVAADLVTQIYPWLAAQMPRRVHTSDLKQLHLQASAFETIDGDRERLACAASMVASAS